MNSSTSRVPRTLKGLLILSVSLVVTPLLIAAPASAHATLDTTTPVANARLAHAPGAITLAFNDKVNRPSYIVVTAPDGKIITKGEATVDNTTVTKAFADPGQAGTFRVAYRVISDDGHPVKGTYTFKVTTGTPESINATTTSTSSGGHLGSWLIGILVLVVVGAAAGLRLRRRR